MKPSILLSLALAFVVAGIGFGWSRERLLVELQKELSLRHTSSSTIAAVSGKLPASSGETHSREKGSFVPLVRSNSGRESVPEVCQCLADYLARGPYQIPERRYFPEVDRMKVLLSAMGADAVGDVFAEASRRKFPTEVVEKFYLSMNPSQALLFALDLGPAADPFRHDFVVKSYTAWTYMDPEAALQWLREESKKGNPEANDPALQLQAAICCGRVDPKRAAAMIVHLSETVPGSVGLSTGYEMANFLRTPSERVDLLLALDRAADGSPNGEVLRGVRDAAVQQLMVNLSDQSLEESKPVVDAGFTPAERQKFADRLGGAKPRNLNEVRDWASWLAEQEGSPGYIAPVENFLNGEVERFPEFLEQTDWIEKLPDHAAQQRAIHAYTACLMRKKPEEARLWLERLDEGPQKETLRGGF